MAGLGKDCPIVDDDTAYGCVSSQYRIDAVTQTALDYNLLSKYTAFIAVDETPKEISQSSTETQSESLIAASPQSKTSFNSNNSILNLLFL